MMRDAQFRTERLRRRARRGVPSSLLTALLLLLVRAAPAQVVINEIMYHPYEPWPSTQPTKTTNDSEYIELYNAGTSAVDLTEYRFDNGVNFNFPAGTILNSGAYLVVCGNTFGFTSYYPTVTNYIGGFQGALNNGGERVTLSRYNGADWVTADTIHYIDGGRDDGEGPSLELVNPGFARLSDQYYGDWAASRTTNGTPGRINSVFTNAPPPVVGNVLHSPALPPGGSSITITCRAAGRDSDILQSVRLEYRRDQPSPLPWTTNVLMKDDGLNGDAAAQDGIFSARLPEYGQPVFTNGTLLEFRIVATDAFGSRRYPATNTAGVVTGANSYLCAFGEDTYADCDYPGEYATYHLLLNSSNKAAVFAQTGSGATSDTYLPLDGTLITPDGVIHYNCGVRQRGSTRIPPFSYAVELPPGQSYDGTRRFDFSFQNQFNNFLGFKITEQAGIPSLQVQLMRLWLNESRLQPTNAGVGQGMYIRVERPQDVISRIYPNDDGNLYKADGDGYRTGDFSVWPTLADYQKTGVTGKGYECFTGNPYTAWVDLSNLTWALNQPASNLPSVVSSRVNSVHGWSRLLAVNTAINNREYGMLCPAGIGGDELRIYGDQNGQFTWIPWDYSDTIAGIPPLWGYTGGVQGTVTNFLFSRPFLPYYAGDVQDVLNNVMSASNMNAWLDTMGSYVTNRGTNWRTYYLNNSTSIRNNITAQLSTNFTVNFNGIPPGNPVTVSSPVLVDVPYVVAPVDQRTNAWVLLGTWMFLGNAQEYVEVTRVIDSSTNATVANAVMLSNSVSVIVTDRSDTNRYSETGTWVNQPGYSPTGSSITIRTSTSTGSTARWIPNVTSGGVYSVYAACSKAYGFGLTKPTDPSASYTIVTKELHPVLNLSGTAPQAYTDRILVNGLDRAAWSNRGSAWTATDSLVMLSNINTVLVQAVDSEGAVLRSARYTVIDNGAPQFKSGTVSSDTTWSNTNGVICVSGDVTVSGGARLTIASNSVVTFGSGRKILVSDGALDIGGTAQAPVFLCASNGSFTVEAAGASASVTGRYFTAVGGAFSAGSGARLTLEDATLTNAPAGVAQVAANAATSVTLRRCIVSDYSRMTFMSTPVVVEQCLLENMTQAGLEFSGAATSLVMRTTIRQSTADGAAGVRFSSQAAGGASNCLFHTLSGEAAVFDSSPAVLSGSLIYQCGTGIVARTTAATNHHNTVTDCRLGLTGASSDTRSSILWFVTNAISAGPATASYCDIQLTLTNLYAGTANINREPWFRDTAGRDYRLSDISPCLDSGENGTTMGAAFPVGACPAGPSLLTMTNVTDTRIELRWQDNSDDESWFEIERSDDGGPWNVITNLPANATAYTNDGLSQQTLYQYRVRAAHNRGRSLPSDVAEAETAVSTSTQLLADNLRISEIMYDPAVDSACEFIELQNIGTNSLDLSGLYFNNGITYAFPTNTTLSGGAFLVLVKSPASFTSRYATVSYQGVFTGSLANEGERLRIKDAGGNTIVDVNQYDPAWYPTTAGGGYSLVLADPLGIPNEEGSWRPSANVNGSPGAADPDPGYGTVVINEVLTHQDTDNPGDWIELYNAATTTANIAGWYLSDNPSNLKKFQIGSTNIAPHGYCVFSEYHDFGTNVLGTNGFGLSELGEDVYLSSGSNGVLTSYRTFVKFGAADRDVTFGRHTRSDGEVDFTPLSSQTPGASNAYPLVGPVVINEIMYNPSAGGKEYVELYNATGAGVPLFDPAHSTNTWRFNGAFEYTFPPGVSLSPHAYALVVSVEPTNFRALFGITSTAVQVFGPFDGALANNGETVKLYKPGEPELDGTVPQYLVDRVQYNDKAPWPTMADNGGPSLERIAAQVYGNDPTNWTAGTVGGTPGTANNSAGLPSVAFRDPNGRSYESESTVTVDVVLSPAIAATVTVQCAATGGTASNGVDYVLPPVTLVFWPHETLKTIPLVIHNDGSPEPDETVELSLSALSPNARLGGNQKYTLTIVDTNATPLSAPAIMPAGTTLFSNSIVVAIQSTVSNSIIRYTTDGTRPEFNDPVYSTPFVLGQSARVSARTFLGSYNAGSWTSALFLAQTPPTNQSGPTSYWFTVMTNGSGTVTGGNVQVPAGSNATANATASYLYHFGGWSGDVGGANTNSTSITVLMNSNRTVTATFLLDPVHIANAAAVAGGFEFSWLSVTEAMYEVFRSTNLMAAWPVTPLTNEPGHPSGTNTFTDGAFTNSAAFYRIKASVP